MCSWDGLLLPPCFLKRDKVVKTKNYLQALLIKIQRKTTSRLCVISPYTKFHFLNWITDIAYLFKCTVTVKELKTKTLPLCISSRCWHWVLDLACCLRPCCWRTSSAQRLTSSSAQRGSQAMPPTDLHRSDSHRPGTTTTTTTLPTTYMDKRFLIKRGFKGESLR